MKRSLFALLIIFIACRKEKIDFLMEVPTEYVNIKPGMVIIWDFDSIDFNSFFQRIDTFNFLIKDSVREPFIDGEGRSGYIIERYIKFRDSSSWDILKVFYIIINEKYFIEVYDNIPTLKITTPIRDGTSWNGNVFNSLKEQTFTIKRTKFDTIINSNVFSNCIEISHGEEVNAIEEKVSREIYSKNIGLIYKEVLRTTIDYSSGGFRRGHHKFFRLRYVLI